MNSCFWTTTAQSKKGTLRMYFWSLKFKMFLQNSFICFFSMLMEDGWLVVASCRKLVIYISVDANISHHHQISPTRWLACCLFCLLQVYWRETEEEIHWKISTPVLRRNIKQFKPALPSSNLVASLLQYLPALSKYCMRYLKVRTQLLWISISMNHY